MIVACVCTGPRYGPEYIERLRAGVARHLKRDHWFICLTDRPRGVPDVDEFYIHGLEGWWGKMALFEVLPRYKQRVLYFDLDSVIVGDLEPLAALDVDFGICANFTRAAGHLDWPCRYGSCVMTMAPGFGGDIWRRFNADSAGIMGRAGYYGDQKAIEELHPAATLLQDVLPKGFFLGYRDLFHVKPEGCSVVVFAGKSKPHTCKERWVTEAWAA